MTARGRFLTEQTFSDGDADFLGSAGSKSSAKNKIVRRLPQIMGTAFIVEHDLADRSVVHILFFSDAKFEALRLSWRQGDLGIRGVQLRRKESERRGGGVTDEERLAGGVANGDVADRFYRRVLLDATG